MASYPFLYADVARLLPKLDPIYFMSYGAETSRSRSRSRLMKSHQEYRYAVTPDMEKDMMEWKEILSNLPSVIETHEFSRKAFIAFLKFVYAFHDMVDSTRTSSLHYEWKSLVGPMTEFIDHYWKPIILQSSLSSSLQKSKQPIEESSSGVNLDDELDTRIRLLSSLKAPDVKRLDDLPPQLLPCLAYCGLYPQGSTFIRETLIYQWLAEGFLVEDWLRESSREQVQKGNLYFNKLLEKGVFVEPVFTLGVSSSSDAYKRIHSCKIHPDIHSAVSRMTSNEVLIIPGNKQGSAAPVTTRYVAFHKEDNAEIQSYEFPFQPTTFMCFVPETNKVIMESLFSKFGELRVLYFDGTQFKELPTEFTAFTKLRCLALSRNTLLKRLDCSKYSRLQTLAVDGCVNLEKVDAAAGRLEILQLSHCPELKSFTVTSDRTLEILHIFECPRLESLPKLNYQCLNELVCHNCDSLDLDLGECRGNSNYVEVVGLPKLIELKLGDSRSGSLLIANCSNLKSIDNHLRKSINSLETLRIYDCPNLEISPKVLSSLNELRSIDIRICPVIMTTTFSNDAVEDLVPWIWNKDREFIIDGQRPTNQDVWLFEETDDALEPLLPSSSAQTIEDSKGILEQDLRRKMFLTAINEIKEEHKLYCCLLSSGFEFERDTLVQLWMALGILEERSLEQTGERCFNDLLKERFIIYSRTDILTEMNKYKINDEKVTNFLNDCKRKDVYARLEDDQMAAVNISSLSKCRHVSLVGQKIDERTFKALEGISELRTVLLIRDYGDSLKQIPSSFFEALRCMRALDLSGSHISELPSSIGNMTQLLFLDLSFTLLERIPESIAGLGELQTLKLKGCKHLHTLPKGMKQLHSLRHLEFDILGQLTSMPKGMGQLTKLRTLLAFIVSQEDDDRSSIRELENLNKLGGSLCISGLEYASQSDAYKAKMKKKALTGLHLKWNDSISYDGDARDKACRVLIDLRPDYASLKELKISYYPGSTLTMWVKDEHFINVERLELISCKIERFQAPEALPNLKYLNITDMNGVKIIQGLHPGQRSDQKISFPMLETLIIDGMLNLESWTNIQAGDFPHLTKLRLMHCPELTHLDDLLSILHSLTYLEISHCKKFASLSSKPLLPSLETLIIIKCPELEKYSKGKDGWTNIEHVPNIWIDMKGLGSENQDTDSDDSDSSDEEIDHSSDSDKETGTSKDVSDDVTMM